MGIFTTLPDDFWRVSEYQLDARNDSNCHRLMRLTRAFLSLSAVLLVAALHGRAEVTNLVAIADTALREANPDNNLGGMLYLPVGVTSVGTRNRALFKFDVSIIPTNACIASATLKLISAFASTSGVDYNLHRLLKDWGEGGLSGGGGGTMTLGAPATNGCATWNARFHQNDLWSAPGAQAGTDYVSEPSAVVGISTTGNTNSFISIGILEDVQRWVADPGTNFGWILMQANESVSGVARRMGSREDTANAPVLTINYVIPTAGALALCEPTIIGSRIHFCFSAEPGSNYTVEYRNALGTGEWITLTNIPASPNLSAVGISDVVTGGSRFYRVRSP